MASVQPVCLWGMAASEFRCNVHADARSDRNNSVGQGESEYSGEASHNSVAVLYLALWGLAVHKCDIAVNVLHL